MRKSVIGAVATLVGTVIGAGVLGIPYVFAKSGFLLGFCMLVFLGIVVLLMNLMVGEICLRTKKFYQLVGLASKYLGKYGKFFMLLSFLMGIWGALIAYIIGEGEALAAISGKAVIFGISPPLLFSLLFFAIASALVYLGLKTIEKSEIILTSSVVAVIVVVGLLALGHIDLANLTAFSWKNVLLPYGVVLFALLGAAAVPEMGQILKREKQLLRKSIFIGMLIPISLYAFFALTVLGVTGAKTTEVATIGLGKALGPMALLLGNLFAIFAMAGSFLILGLALKDALARDVGINEKLAFCLTVFVPLLAFLLGAKSFISVIGIAGAFAGGIDGIIIGLMWYKSKKEGDRKPEYSIRGSWLKWLMIIIFSCGIIYTVLSLAGLV